MQAANLVKALRRHAGQQHRTIDLIGLAGAHTEAAGCRLLSNTVSMGAVGLLEPLPYVLPALRTLRRTLNALDNAPPDISILIDYPGFNIPLAQKLRKRFKTPIVYYIPPEEWVWSTKGNRLLDRSHKIPPLIDKVLTLHEQDTNFYRQIGCQVERIGHPLRDILDQRQLTREQARRALGIDDQQRIVALFPASRSQELRLVWPVIAAAAANIARAEPDLIFSYSSGV